jgi:ATP-dependent RNA helicase DDX46/PRP5
MNGKIYYYEEVEINDYPQKARYALNNRSEMDRIQDWTGASIGIRGTYVPPGRKPALGSRKLHLYIEADSPAKVTRAKTECINFLETASKGVSYDVDMMGAYGK